MECYVLIHSMPDNIEKPGITRCLKNFGNDTKKLLVDLTDTVFEHAEKYQTYTYIEMALTGLNIVGLALNFVLHKRRAGNAMELTRTTSRAALSPPRYADRRKSVFFKYYPADSAQPSGV